MIDFVNMLFNGVGLPTLLNVQELAQIATNATGFYSLMRPDVIVSMYVYLACAFGLFSLTLKLLYRLIKKMINYPSRKGCER